MGIGSKLGQWFRLPVVTVETYQCVDCRYQTPAENEECPECGGQMEYIGAETVPTDWV